LPPISQMETQNGVEFINTNLCCTMRLLGRSMSFRYVKNTSVWTPHTKRSSGLNETFHRNAACQGAVSVVQTHGDQDPTAGWGPQSCSTEEFQHWRTFHKREALRCRLSSTPSSPSFCSKVLLQKLTAVQLVKKFPTYTNPKFFKSRSSGLWRHVVFW
jgi:hypothetical protein